MKSWDKGMLGISKNGRYLTEGGQPFFWLADTAWLLLQKLEWEEVRTYLRNRSEKGYNVIQTVLVHTLPGTDSRGCSLAAGIKDVTVQDYWDFVDRVVEYASGLGLYMGLLPAWGSLVKDGVLSESNAAAYGEYLGRRFQKYKNVIWILGGDVRGDVHPQVFCCLAKTLKSWNPDRLIAFHPFGRTSSSQWFGQEDWLDFHMFQSGHRRYDQASLGEWDDNAKQEEFFGEDNWRYVEHDHSLPIMKPTVDAEPSYEGIPQGLHNPHNPYWEEWDVRRYAYWSVFAGAAGHTYGSNAVMQFYDPQKEGKGAYGVRDSWQQALHAPGSSQLCILKKLMESVDYINGRPADELLLYGQKERYHRIAVFAGESYVFCYDYSGDEFLLDMSGYMDKTMDAWWMDPRDGVCSYITTLKGVRKWLASPTARKGSANDWVLLIKERT